MRALLLGLASAAAFVAAAKAHGRELRLEREAAGVLRVVFGGDNPPIVEAIWAAERARFWAAAPMVALALGIALGLAGASRSTLAWAGLLWAPSLVFMVLGAASIVRAGGLERGGIAGSIGWWALAIGALGLVGVVGRRVGW